MPALAHRISLRPELWVQWVDGEQMVDECLAAVPSRSPSSPARDQLQNAAVTALSGFRSRSPIMRTRPPDHSMRPGSR
jgi:hypothetical protein